MSQITTKTLGVTKLVETTTKRGIKIIGVYTPEFPPELQAALGATLSRDPGSIIDRLERLLTDASTQNRIMDVFFKKYGHNSIGDMGEFMISIEGLSMIGALKAIENPLFNGQEASTRYIDFESMGFIPVNKEVDELSEQSFELYRSIKNKVFDELFAEGVPKKEAEPQAFDVAGAFLPISSRTNVFWKGTIRTYITQTRRLMSMGGEYEEIGSAMNLILDKICPNSVAKKDLSSLSTATTLNQECLDEAYEGSNAINWNLFDFRYFNRVYSSGLAFGESCYSLCGSVSASFEMDFRSIRDIHRHRAFSVNTISSLKARGFENFYLQKLPVGLRDEVSLKITSLLEQAQKLDGGFYGLPMGVKMRYTMHGDLNAWTYFLDLRSGPKVHPTVISRVQEIGANFEANLRIKDLYKRGSADYSKRSADANKT